MKLRPDLGSQCARVAGVHGSHKCACIAAPLAIGDVAQIELEAARCGEEILRRVDAWQRPCSSPQGRPSEGRHYGRQRRRRLYLAARENALRASTYRSLTRYLRQHFAPLQSMNICPSPGWRAAMLCSRSRISPRTMVRLPRRGHSRRSVRSTTGRSRCGREQPRSRTIRRRRSDRDSACCHHRRSAPSGTRCQIPISAGS
jgi:hypothetical protein